ncbi:MAG: GDP-mannose 4,6-dehydratase [Nanoarchaeota archaeon]
MKKALITGITGQDGSYLSEFLLSKGYDVYGTVSYSSSIDLRDRGLDSRFEYLSDKVKLVTADLRDESSLVREINKIDPDEVYNLGALSFVSTSFKDPEKTSDITGMGVLRILEAIRKVNPKIKFYQASSSEMFGAARKTPQNENTPFHPKSPYGTAKVFGHNTVVNYRESCGIFACSGILFNHESPRRGSEFVTKKVVNTAVKMHLGLENKLVLGRLDPKRDWGYAKDYVEAMWLMLQQKEADDYVIATGETHTVREFVEAVFNYLGKKIAWSKEDRCGRSNEGGYDRSGCKLIEVSEGLFRPAEVYELRGDASKAREKLGWQPKTNFLDLIKIMVDEERKLVIKKQNLLV